MDFLRNLPIQHPEQLARLIRVQEGRVVSMSMSRQEHCALTLLAFGDGECISEECYWGDTLYFILDGMLSLSMEGGSHRLRAGDCMAVPAHVSHGISAHGSCKLLQLTLS